jgi:hypothetical protein
MASRDVQRVYETLNEAILHLAESLFLHAHNKTDKDSRNLLNAPQYLFVSTTAAKAFPKLMESMLISAYKTYLPGHVANKWKDHSPQYNNDRSHNLKGQFGSMRRIIVAVTSIVSWIIQMIFAAIFAYIPLSIQKFILRVLQPFIATGILYAWWYALTGYRSIVVIGSCLGLLFVYLLYQHRKFKKRRQNRLLSILPLVNALDEKEQEHKEKTDSHADKNTTLLTKQFNESAQDTGESKQKSEQGHPACTVIDEEDFDEDASSSAILSMDNALPSSFSMSDSSSDSSSNSSFSQ